jgi:hypothetical protein
MAQQLQSQGRGDDKMLVHMTPGEVGGLQQLAMAHGGSLTINPQTGLPEAGFLSKLLPTLIGFGLNFIPGVGPLLAAGITAAGATAVTGDLGKGLTAGLQAFGGAGLSGALAPGATQSLAALKTTAPAVTTGAATPLTAPASGMFSPAVTGVGSQALSPLAGGAINPALGVGAAQQAAGAGAKGFLGRFAAETSLGQTGMLGKALPIMAGSAVLGGVSDAMQPKLPTYKKEDDGFNYEGPYVPSARKASFLPYEEMKRTGGAEGTYFTPSNPMPGFRPASSLSPEERAEYGFADGGLAALPASNDFAQLTDYFNAQNPGAITASMYPTAVAMPTRETRYDFNRPATPATPNPTPNVGGPGGGMIGMPDLSNLDLNSILAQIGYVPRDGTPATTPIPNRDIASAPTTDLYRGGIEIPPTTSFNPSMPSVGRDNSGLELLTPSLNIQPPSQLYDIPAPQIMDIAQPTQMAPFDMPTMDIQQSAPRDLYDFAPQVMAPEMPTMDIQQPVARDVYDFAPMPSYMPENIYDYSRMRDMGMEEFAAGGPVNMRDGAFVVDARTVSELGNGSSNAGMELLSRMGGKPLHGPGDGVSDSIPARIGGKQEARVARDEVIFQPDAVKRIGGGSEKRGTAKLYSLMDKAHKARKKAKRGQDTGLRRGLA